MVDPEEGLGKERPEATEIRPKRTIHKYLSLFGSLLRNCRVADVARYNQQQPQQPEQQQQQRMLPPRGPRCEDRDKNKHWTNSQRHGVHGYICRYIVCLYVCIFNAA